MPKQRPPCGVFPQHVGQNQRWIYMYIYIYNLYTCMYIYIYIYIYMNNPAFQPLQTSHKFSAKQKRNSAGSQEFALHCIWIVAGFQCAKGFPCAVQTVVSVHISVTTTCGLQALFWIKKCAALRFAGYEPNAQRVKPVLPCRGQERVRCHLQCFEVYK